MFAEPETSPANGHTLAADKPRGRTHSSRITNGSAFVPGVDQRSAWVRRGKDVESSLLAELGGAEHVTAQQRLLVRKIAVLETELNRREQRFAEAGEATDEELAGYSTVVNAQRRLLADIGLERRARDVTPDVRTYVAEKASRRAAAAATTSRTAEDASVTTDTPSAAGEALGSVEEAAAA